MEDLIYRQQAIDVASGYCHPANIADELRKLPPAEPKVIRCKDCKHWKNKHLCKALSRHGTFETSEDFYCGYAERKVEE